MYDPDPHDLVAIRNAAPVAVRKYANGAQMTHATIAEDVAAFESKGGAIERLGVTRAGDAPELRKSLADMERGRDALAKKRNPNSIVVLPGSLTGPKPQTIRYNAKRSKVKPELADIPSFVEGTQHCWDCKQTKPLAAFSASPNRKNGVRDQCKECHKAYWKRYVAKRRAAA